MNSVGTKFNSDDSSRINPLKNCLSKVVECTKKIAGSAMKTIDQAYDTIGFVGFFGVSAVCLISLALVNPPIWVLSAFGISSLVTLLLLKYRHARCEDNKYHQQLIQIEKEVSGFNRMINQEKFVNKINNSQSSAELEANMKTVMDRILSFEGKLQAIAKSKDGFENRTVLGLKYCIQNLKDCFENKVYGPDRWQTKKKDFVSFLQDVTHKLEKELLVLQGF